MSKEEFRSSPEVRTGFVKGNTFGYRPVRYSVIDGEAIFEGDIVLGSVDEMERLGWIGAKRPRMIAVQAAGCAPVPKAFAEGKAVAEKWENAETYASGLRVPKPFADFVILAILRESGGDAVTVTDDEMRAAENDVGEAEGMFVCPEGAATWAAAKKLAANGRLDSRSRVVLFNTGTGFKYWGQT